MPEKKIWIPARPAIDSHDSHPEVPLQQKLAEIKQKRAIRVVPDRNSRNPDGFHNLYRAKLPYTKGIACFIKEDSEDIELWDLDLGDKALYGRGIGTRLLQRVVDYAITQKNPDAATISRGVGNWALVKTLGKVLGGDEYVSFRRFGKEGPICYGQGSDRPIEAVFSDFPPPPPEAREDYNVHDIVGSIDSQRLLSGKAAREGVRADI